MPEIESNPRGLCWKRLIDRGNHHLLSSLYQTAPAGLSRGEFAAPVGEILTRQTNARDMLAEETAIDLMRRFVETDGCSFPCDFLAVATGARHACFGHPEWVEHAPDRIAPPSSSGGCRI